MQCHTNVDAMLVCNHLTISVHTSIANGDFGVLCCKEPLYGALESSKCHRSLSEVGEKPKMFVL